MKFNDLLIFLAVGCLSIGSLSAEPTTIYVVRHGQSAWNVEHRIQGQIDTNLTDLGRLQAQNLAENLASNGVNIDAIYASPLKRAFHTGKAIGDLYGIKVQADDRLKEIHWGVGQGMIVEDKVRKYGNAEMDYSVPNREELWKLPSLPEAESYNDALQRLLDVVHELAQKHEGETILLATHSGMVKLLSTYAVEGAPPKVPNCAIAKFYFDPSKDKSLTYHGIIDYNRDVVDQQACPLEAQAPNSNVCPNFSSKQTVFGG